MRYFLFFICSSLLIACSDKNSIPKDLIEQKSMQKIVWDILQADEIAFQNKLKDTTILLKTESFKLYDQVFAIHKISRDRFYKSYSYYQRHPDLYKSLMNGIRSIADKERKVIVSPAKI
jgi:hypothetical protein